MSSSAVKPTAPETIEDSQQLITELERQVPLSPESRAQLTDNYYQLGKLFFEIATPDTLRQAVEAHDQAIYHCLQLHQEGNGSGLKLARAYIARGGALIK